MHHFSNRQNYVALTILREKRAADRGVTRIVGAVLLLVAALIAIVLIAGALIVSA